MAYNNQGGNNKLEPIFSYSWPGVHLLQISIVRQIADDGQQQSYKKQFFCFITLAPGAKQQDGSRTFDFQNKITMKAEADRILALGHAMTEYAKGNDKLIGPFSIFSDSSKSQFNQGQGSTKSLAVVRNTDKNNNPNITIFFKVGQNQPLAFAMMCANALAFGEICNFIGNRCIELEFGRDSVSVKPNNIPQGTSNGTGSGMPFAAPSPAAPVPSTGGSVATGFETALNDMEDDNPF